MSRIEEEREAARQVERLALKQREEEQRKKTRTEAETRFADRLGQQQHQQVKSTESARQTFQEHQEAVDQGAKHQKLAEQGEHAREGVRESVDQARARRWLAERGERWRTEGDDAGHRHAQTHAVDDSAGANTSFGRSEDGNATSDRSSARKKASDADADARAQGAAAERSKASGRLAADADGQGAGSGGRESKDGDSAGGNTQTFRLNPALLAPAPIAQPKETSASERLRALANEIAQKIVERVRIGTNASGVAEFQIELRSNVLSGLNIHVSGTKGRIRAVFSGRDSKVMKLIRDHSEGLKKALESRGLQLEALKFEERP